MNTGQHGKDCTALQCTALYYAKFEPCPFSSSHQHLTNSSVQKERSDKQELPQFLRDAVPAGGSKCSLVTLQALLAGGGLGAHLAAYY